MAHSGSPPVVVTSVICKRECGLASYRKKFCLMATTKSVSTGRRSRKRVKVVVPVKVFVGNDQENGELHLAHTLDVNSGGVRLGGLRLSFRVGEVISIQRGHKRGRFRVLWVREMQRGENQVGLESLEPNRDIWSLDVIEEIGDNYKPQGAKSAAAKTS